MRLAQSIDAGYNLDTPSVVKAKYRGAGPILGAAGKCIDDAGASTDNGSAIQIFTCNGTGAQSWTWNSSDGTLRALDKCMDVTGGATASGTPVQLWECNGTGAQEWRWRQQSRLVNPQSGRCLDVAGGGAADGTRLQISDCGFTRRLRFGVYPEKGRGCWVHPVAALAGDLSSGRAVELHVLPRQRGQCPRPRFCIARIGT